MKKKHTTVTLYSSDLFYSPKIGLKIGGFLMSLPINTVPSESNNACRHVQYEEILTRWKSIQSIHTPVIIGNFI